MEERCADPTTQAAIDEAILDYLLYTATKSLLLDPRRSGRHDSSISTSSSAELPLQMADAFLAIFHALHPAHRASSELKFRLRLLKFACLFTSCTAPGQRGSLRCSSTDLANVASLGNAGHGRAVKKETRNDSEADAMDIDGVLSVVALESSRGPGPCVSLLDTLPAFMALSAAQNAGQESNVTLEWIRLAGTYMAQAAIDRGLKRCEITPHDLDQAFGKWKFDPDLEEDESSDAWYINAMFWADDDLLPGWEAVKEENRRTVLEVPQNVSLQEHLGHLRETRFSYPEFCHSVSVFIEALLIAQSPPLLLQLENGKVQGLSDSLTAGLLKGTGLSPRSSR